MPFSANKSRIGTEVKRHDAVMTDAIKIVEVGPRDGLQNEDSVVDTDGKIEFINQLSLTGLSHIEVSSFVNPQRIPQLADAAQVFLGIDRRSKVHYGSLVPNEQGMRRAIESKPDSVALFTAVSETFCQKNINCSIDESLQRFIPVIDMAQKHNLPVRAYISCVVGCPYEGFIDAEKTAVLSAKLIEMGCHEISLGDTIGAGTPKQIKSLIHAVEQQVAIENVAVHFHDTRGQALANILASLEQGVTTIDSSVAGLGGCPYANGASGNVATEDVVYLLHGMGFKTGIDLAKLIEVGKQISSTLNRVNNSRVGSAGVPNEYTSYAFTQ